MKRLLFIVAVVMVLFFVIAGVFYVFGDALMQKEAEIERLQDELERCRETRLM